MRVQSRVGTSRDPVKLGGATQTLSKSKVSFVLTPMLVALFACSGNSIASRFGAKGDASHLHKVSYRGETLSEISQWYTGKASNWRTLGQINDLSEPHRLKLGQVVAVPRSLLQRSDAPPKSYFTPAHSASKQASRRNLKPTRVSKYKRKQQSNFEVANTHRAEERTVEKAEIEREVLRDRLLTGLLAEYDRKYGEAAVKDR